MMDEVFGRHSGADRVLERQTLSSREAKPITFGVLKKRAFESSGMTEIQGTRMLGANAVRQLSLVAAPGSRRR